MTWIKKFRVFFYLTKKIEREFFAKIIREIAKIIVFAMNRRVRYPKYITFYVGMKVAFIILKAI